MIYLETYAEEISKALRFVAPTFLSTKWLADNTVSPPRYVWVRGNDRMRPSTVATGIAGSRYGEIGYSVNVHCWGKHVTECDILRRYLISGFIEKVPLRYITIGEASWIEPKHMEHGAVVIQEMTIWQPFEPLHIPNSETDPIEDCVALANVASIVYEQAGLLQPGQPMTAEVFLQNIETLNGGLDE